MNPMPESMPGRLAVPLFPLPDGVLLPGAILPLHIFEPRYRKMTADALDGAGRIAMAMLRPGWEKVYYGRPAIEPAVCIGQIVAHERLDDGNYNFLLQGLWRAMVVDETVAGDGTPYRVADLVPLAETRVLEIDLVDQRERLTELFAVAPLSATGIGRQFARLLGGPTPTPQIADLIAFNYLKNSQVKQSLLAEGDVRRRVVRLVDAMVELQPCLHPAPGPDASLN